jgi:hypothetical protein
VRRWLKLHGLESPTDLRFADARNADEGPAVFRFKDHQIVALYGANRKKMPTGKTTTASTQTHQGRYSRANVRPNSLSVVRT